MPSLSMTCHICVCLPLALATVFCIDECQAWNPCARDLALLCPLHPDLATGWRRMPPDCRSAAGSFAKATLLLCCLCLRLSRFLAPHAARTLLDSYSAWAFSSKSTSPLLAVSFVWLPWPLDLPLVFCFSLWP